MILCLMATMVFTASKCYSHNNSKYIEREDVDKRREMAISDSLDHLDAVSKLKGLGQLHIGYTSFEQVKNNFNIYSDSWCNSEIFGCGYWSDDFRKIGDDVNELSNISQYIYKNEISIKEYTTWDYQIGDIKIGRVSCAFYKNKLIAISFNSSKELLNIYVEKYGNGCSHFVDSSDWLFEYIDRTWSNDNVTLKYIARKRIFIISSNDGIYDKFVKYLITYKEQYKVEKEKNRQSLIDQF